MQRFFDCRLLIVAFGCMLMQNAWAYGWTWKPKAEDPDNVLTNDCHTSATWPVMEQGYGTNTVSLSANSTVLPSTIR